MATLAELIVRIGADISGFEGEIKGVNQKARAMGRDLENIGRGLTLGVTVPLVGMGAAALKAAGEFEQTVIGFNTMLGSGERAAALLKDLENFAKNTPFEFTDLTDASKRLLAMGIQAERIIPTLSAVGDAVAAVGGGAVGVDRVTTAIGQMSAKGKVSAEEMRQLTEAGIPAWELLAETLNTDVAGAMDLVQKRAVDSGPAIEGMIQGINERFGGMMEEQSKTLLGQFSNLQDELGFILRDFGAGLVPAAQEVMDAIRPIAAEVRELGEAFKDADPATQKMITSLGGVVAAVGPAALVLGQLANLSASSWKGLQTLASALFSVASVKVAGIVAAGAAIIALADAFRDLGSAQKEAIDGRQTLAQQNQKLAAQLREIAKATDEVSFTSRDTWPQAQESIEEYNKRLREMFLANKDVISQHAPQKAAMDAYIASVKTGTGDIVSFGSATSDAAKEAEKARAHIEALTAAELRMAAAASHITESQQDLGEALKVINDNRIHELGENIRAATEDLEWLANQAPDVGDAAIDTADDIEALGEALGTIPEKAEKASKGLSQVSTIITDFGKDVATGLFDVLLGGSRNDFNRRLEEQASSLRDSLREAESDLRSSLSDRTAAYEEFARDTMDAIAGVRQEEAERLADQLSDLRENLSDRRQDYDRYVDDIATKLARINEDYRDNLEDQNRALKEALAERKVDYDRDVEDLRRSHERKVQDLQQAIADELANGQEADQRRIRDLQTRLARENEDYRIALERRNEDFRSFQAQQARDAAEYAAEQRERLNRETTDLNNSLQERTADYQAYVDDVNRRAAELTAESRKREEEKVAALREALAKQEAQHKEFVDKATAEYERLKAETTAQLAEIHGQHKSVFDDIGNLFKDVFAAAGEAIARFVAEYLVGLLIPKLKTVTDLFGGIFGGGSSSHSVGFPELGGSTGSGMGSAAGSGLGSAINIATGIASAVGSAFTAYFTGMNGRILELIEKSTRFTELYTKDMRETLFHISENTDYLTPNLDDIKSTLWSIRDALQGGITIADIESPITLDPPISLEVAEGIERSLTRGRSRLVTPLPGGPGIDLNPGDTTGLFGPNGLRRGRGRGGQLPTRDQLEAMGLTSGFMQFGTTGPANAHLRTESQDPGLTGDLWERALELRAFARENAGNSSAFLGGVHGKTLQAIEINTASIVALVEGVPTLVQGIADNVSIATPDVTSIKDGTWRTNEILEVISSKLDTLSSIASKLDNLPTQTDSLTSRIATA